MQTVAVVKKSGPEPVDFSEAELANIDRQLAEKCPVEQIIASLGMKERTFYERLRRANKRIEFTGKLVDRKPNAAT